MSTAPSADSAGPRPERGTAVLILTVTLILVLFEYLLRTDLLGTFRPGEGWTALSGPARSLLVHEVGALLLLGVAPVLVARFALGRTPASLGLGRGNLTRSLAWLAVGLPTAILLGRSSAGHPDVQAVYPLAAGEWAGREEFLLRVVLQLLYYGSWEVLFRGVLLHGLTPRFGFAGANALQTSLSVLAHLGRPLSETLAALPAGLVLGGVARNSGSIWPVVLIHWTAGMAQDWFLITGGA